jgi:hypothetical protein
MASVSAVCCKEAEVFCAAAFARLNQLSPVAVLIQSARRPPLRGVRGRAATEASFPAKEDRSLPNGRLTRQNAPDFGASRPGQLG